MAAKNKIRYEIQELNDRLKKKKENIQTLKEQIEKIDDTDGLTEENLT